MALSDDILSRSATLSALKARLGRLISESEATGAFLVDEVGTPFATVGPVEFGLGGPWVGFSNEQSAASILAAMIGQTTDTAGKGSGDDCIVERVGTRALLIILHPPGDEPSPAERRSFNRAADQLAEIIASPPRTNNQ